MDKLKAIIEEFLAEEDGATMIEYGLLAALIALVVAAAVVTIGTALNDRFTDVGNCVDDATGAACTP